MNYSVISDRKRDQGVFQIIHRLLCLLILHPGVRLPFVLKIFGCSISYSKEILLSGGSKTPLTGDRGTNS